MATNDGQLFDEAYREHRHSIRAFFFGHTQNDDVASDLTQETYLRVWRHIETLRHIPIERRKFWLFAIAKNILADYYRRRSVRDRLETGTMELGFAGGSDPASVVESGETLDAIDRAIKRLPENLREVLALHTMGEMSSEEIGEVLGRPAGTIRYQLSQARKMLNELLGSSE